MMFWFDRHRRLRDRLSAYIDGALDPPAAARLEAHLAQCGRCRAELEQLRATVAALGELPEAGLPRSFALASEQAAAPRPATAAAAPLAFGVRVAAAGVAVALAAVLVVDLGDLGGDGAPQGAADIEMAARRQAEEAVPGPVDGEPAAEGAPGATPAAPEATAEDAGAALRPDTGAAETPAAGPEEAEAPAAAPSGGGIDSLTAAEIGLAAALGVLVGGSLVLAFAGRKR